MVQTPNQIEAHIEHTQKDLGANLKALELKVKEAADWKHLFKTNPMTMLGIAFGGGVLLASIVGGRGRTIQALPANYVPAVRLEKTSNGMPTAVSETWDHIKGALIGVAATRATDFIDSLIPGFQQKYRDAVAGKKPLSV